MTTSLFGTTLLVSFLVVGMPHILPCPAPRTQFADYEITEDGKHRRRRRPSTKRSETEHGTDNQTHTAMQGQMMGEEEQEMLRKKAHECPVPKPSGRIGEMLGFPKQEEQVSTPTKIQIERRVSGG
ncbi:MAG: hypothetical protein Q9168_007907 [Polycauliona sp. 1 TL-2023]